MFYLSPPPLRSTRTQIHVLDVNERPVILPTSRSVDENTLVGIPFGDPIEASDPDTDQVSDACVPASR